MEMANSGLTKNNQWFINKLSDEKLDSSGDNAYQKIKAMRPFSAVKPLRFLTARPTIEVPLIQGGMEQPVESGGL
jgi:hypothetical protein